MATRSKALLAALIGTVMLGPTACAADDPQSSGTSKVRFTEVIHSIFYAPQYVAQARGYFEKAGLDVQTTTSQGTDKGAAALISRSADVALVGPEAAIQIAANPEGRTKTRIIAVLTSLDGTFLVSKDGSPFTWESLRGKTIIGWKPGGTPELILEALLAKHDLRVGTDVRVITNLDFAARDAAFLKGQADYISQFEPNVAQLESRGAKSVLSIGESYGPHPETAYLVTDEFARDNPKVVDAWISAVTQAREWTQRTPPVDVAKTLEPYFPGITLDNLEAAVTRYQDLGVWDGATELSRSGYDSVQSLLVAGGILKPGDRVDYSDVVLGGGQDDEDTSSKDR